MIARSQFSLDQFDQEPPYSVEDGVSMGRAAISKTFTGDLTGTSTVQMLATRSPDGGAGYVAMERIHATVHGVSGTFVLLHAGTMTSEGNWATWPIVPGSGTGGLAGITGDGTIEIEPDGTHHFTLEYELPS